MILSIMSTLAEDEARQVSLNAKWGIQKRFQMGTYILPRPLYGYKKDGYRLLIDPEKAPVVHRIFMSVLMGKGAITIARELNEDGIEGPKGNGWSHHTIRNIFKDPTYTGDLIMQKTYTDENYRQHDNDGTVDMYIDEDHHEAIINREVFELVQQEVRRRAEYRKIAYHPPTDLNLICGCCGMPMWRSTFYTRSMGPAKWRQKEVQRAYYYCSSKKRAAGTCKAPTILEESIFNAIATMINKLKFVAEKVKPLRKDANDTIREAVEHGFDSILISPDSIEFHFTSGLIITESLFPASS